MVEPGASAAEIRGEIFETFRRKIDKSEIDEDVAETILANALADDPPHEFSKQVLENGN